MKPFKRRRYNSMSDAGKSLAQRAKRAFARHYPDVKVGIDSREGWITVDGKKAVNMSSASSRPMDLDDVIDQMKQAYLGRPISSRPSFGTWKQPTYEGITKNQIRKIIRERVGADEVYDNDDYYEQRIQDEREELYLEDLSILKGIVEKYGAIDMQRIMGDVKKERHLQRYSLNDIEDMLDELYDNDEIDYDEGSRQWVAI